MTKRSHQIFFGLILLLGILIRIWEFGTLPLGLHQDEASSAVDAYYLVHYGVDRNGISYPVHFMAWGSGQSFLYGYLLMPFVAIDLNPITVRLPMLILGILTLPLIYLAAKRTAGERFALTAIFLLAISPWHIMLSRWGHEDNTLPFVFLLGYVFLLKSNRENCWFVIACVFFALCFYAYGAAYVAVPVFLLLAIPILFYSNKVTLKSILWGLAILTILCIPIGLFVLVNSLKLSTIHLGLFTIPRFPVQARYEALSVLFEDRPLQILTNNLRIMLRLLALQTDGLIWNSLDLYGYFYRVTFPFAVIGGILLLASRRIETKPERWLILAWLVAAGVIGTQIEVSINRINLIFIPLILCAAFFLEWLAQYSNKIFAISICVFLIGFTLFTRDYFGESYSQESKRSFFAGLLPALEFAQQAGEDNRICVTDLVNMPYIFALFTEKPEPAEFLSTVEYIDPDSDFRRVRRYGRYDFGRDNCPIDPATVYVLRDEERPPHKNPAEYAVTTFNSFKVFVPRK